MKPLQDFVRNANSDRIKSLLDNRASVVAVMGILTLHLSLDLIFSQSSNNFGHIKAVLSILAVLVLGNMLLKSKLKDDPAPNNSIVKENFDFKSTVTLVASPDEILAALSSPDLRPQFDQGLDSLTKLSDTQYTLNYSNSLTESVTLRSSSNFIEEDINNGEYQRYYEIVPV